MSFYLSDKDYNNIIGIISGNPGGGNKKGNDNGGTYIDMPAASAEPKQQGIVADTVDAVQMGAWKGLSDIAHGVGALTGAEWLHKVGDWAAEGADENLATMSDEMKVALNQNAFDGEGQGVRNVRWWAGNLGSLIGQNLDTVITLGAGKAATFGVKQAGKLLLKKEAAEEVGKAAVEQAAKRGIPQKYWNMVGITATMSAMSGGSRYGQKRDEVLAMSNEQLAQIPQFSDAYYEIADSEEGKDKSVEEIYSMAKSRFADKVGNDAALNPTAIATDLATNAVSGLGGGFWGLGNPAKTVKGGLLKGAMVEGGTEGIQGIGEQYALNKAEQDNYNPNKDLTEGMWDNAVNGIVLGGAFGSAMGGLDTYTDRRAFNNQKRTLLNHINTGNEAIDSQLRNYVDMLNQGATDLSDLVSASRVQALNNAGIANARVRQAEEDTRAQQQANTQFESDFFGEEQSAQPNEPEFTIDPQMERAVYVAKALEKFRKGDLSGANEFISDPMIFADNQARSQFVIGRSFDELKNIAQSYGLDPKDGKAMRRWIEDYIAKAREFNENNQQPTPESNLQFSANVAPENRSGVVSGANDEIDVGNGNYQPIQYEVVDATALSPTQQKDDNQFRDRDRTASQSQINNIARNLDPRKLASSPTMDMGAPLLALDGKTIIAGNGRTMAIRQAYQEGGAEGYRQFLKDNADRFGIDSAQLDSFENPVLVRRLTSPVDIAQVAINSNEQGGMRMSDLEQAKVDARRLPSMDSFNVGESGDINSPDNQQFIRQFVKNQPENLRNELLDGKGNLSQAGVQRIRNAMLYQAYGDSQTLSRLIENTDQGAKNVLNALTALAPKVAQTQQDINAGTLSDVSISNDIIQAVEKYNQLNAQGYKISDYLAQNDFVGDLSPEAREILTIFDENRRSGKRIAQVLGAYFDQAQAQGNLSQASMFGDVAFDKLGSLQQAKNVDEEVRYSFAGENAQTANKDLLAQAKSAVENGRNPEVVRRETGWFQGVDGKWRFELDSSKFELNPEAESGLSQPITKLSDVIDAESLFKAYPDLADLRVVRLPEGESSYYSPRDDAIYLRDNGNSQELKSTLMHEVQHAIQRRENFARGGSAKQFSEKVVDMNKVGLDNARRMSSFYFNQLSEKGKEYGRSINRGENVEENYRLLSQNPEDKMNWASYLHTLSEAKEFSESGENLKIISPLEQYRQLAGEVESRNVQQRMNMTAEERYNTSPESTEDVPRSQQAAAFGNDRADFALHESANSDFAKAVDTVIQGGKPSKKYIPMGTTPPVLVMLGVQNTKVLINRDVLNKVMLGKHNVTPAALKQLPRQINNPVAVMKSAPRATQQGYVVLTELIEVNPVNGAKEPVISALHLRTAKDGIEVINIASVYGKNLGGLQNMLNHDLLYWNKQKGSQLINAFGLQLPAKIASNSVSLNGYSNIKTEADLSQYLSAKNNQESSANQEIQRAQAIINKTFGKAAQHIEVTTFANPPKDVKNLITSDVEGWFNPRTGKITIVADSIKPTKTMTKDERLQFVAWHEMAHRGINVGYKGTYDNLMAEVGKNKAVSQIADAIQNQRKGTDDLAATNRTVAIEEAIAEIMAANETGKWNELESRYGVEIKKGQRQSAKSWLAMTAQRIKEFLSKIFGVERASQFSDEDVLNLVANIKKSAVGNVNESDNLRFSRKAKQEYQRDLMVTHNISAEGIIHANKMGGLPLASVAVAKQSNPLTGFGEVTLIGSRDYIDPKGANKAKVFGSDIYAPRYPRITYEYSAKDQKALFDRFKESAKEIDDHSFDYNFTHGLSDTGARQAMLDSDAVKYQFSKQHNIPYEQGYREIKSSPYTSYPSVQKAIKLGVTSRDLEMDNSGKYESLFREFIQDFIQEQGKSDNPLIKNTVVRAKQALKSGKNEIRLFAVRRMQSGLDYRQSDTVPDHAITLSNMRRAVERNNQAFREYVDTIADGMEAKEKIWNGTDNQGRNRYVAHTLENVVKKLKKDLRGGESFNYGMPNVRAAVTPKFKTIADIQENKHRLVSKEEFEKARDRLDAESSMLADKLGVNSWDIYDVLWNAVDENISKAFGYAGIEDTQSNRKAVSDFLRKLEDLPTEYFEGKAKDITQFSDFAGAVVPNDIAKNAYDVLANSGLKIFTYDSSDPQSRANAIKQATNQLDKERGGDILFSRANTMQSALELSQSALAENEPSIWDNLKAKDFSGFKERFNRAIGKVDEMFADSLRPVNDWIDSMHLADQTGNTSSRDHEKRRLKDAMYTAKGKRDAFNSELEQGYLKPILSKIAALSKATKKGKNPIDELTMKRMVGNWISARYSIEKNMDLLRADEKAMRDTKRLLDSAKQNGSMAEINRLSNAYAKAKEQYENRKADIYNTDYKNKGNRFKVGVAGGWSIPEAELIMKNTEQRISRSDLESVANMVYDLNQAKLDIDRASGRYTENEYQEYKANRHYVPLTGDPNADADVDIISGTGSSAVNIGRDKALKGRTNSEAEDAIDAVWKSVGKTTTYAGFAEFKGKIDDLYETEVSMLKEKGYSDSQAREQATANLGISKRKMQGLTRSSDNVLIRKEGGQYYEYELPTQTMEALRNDNVEHANAFLKVISKPTGWYARGVTQWTLTFAPMNMARDTWEKSEFIRVQKMYDKNNRLVDSKTMDKIGRDTLKNAFADKEVWQATKRLGFGQELRDNVPAERMLKQLLKEGGVSNYGTYLDKTETDLIKRLKKENNPIAGKLEKVGKVLEGYNKMFDTVSALSAYKALVENGIDSKQAAATTLELTNFRKTGSKMRGIKALYMFSQPTVMGAANLIRYLSTRKGQVRFVAYLAGMTALYTVLRSMDDDDEGGNKMDQLGDITRYIPIPIGGGHYFKIPVGFGMPQMAWNFSTNIVKGAASDISLTEAGANMLVHSLKTFSPVSPSEISAAKYPMEKLTLTATPTILQPLMQNVLNRSAFGNKITTNFVRDDKLKAEQSKATTAQFWKDVALSLNDDLGIDMHPEQIKNLFDGYSSAFGSLRELNTLFVENPNREQLGRNTRMPFVNQFIGTTNEFSIQSRYYEASEEARKVATEYESRKNRGALDGWLDDDKRKLIQFYEQDKSVTQKMRSEKAKLTRALRSGQISAVAYENGIKRYNKDMSKTQAQILRKYRLMEGLNTN